VRTAIIALGPDLETLDVIATSGGLEGAFFIESGDVADQLRDALLALARGYDGPPGCSFALPPPPPSEDPIDPGLVNVVVDAPSETLRYVERASDCAGTPDAWYYDDSPPLTVHLCPGACERLPAQDLLVAFGCPTER
jgi:hypothetical protein